MKIGLFIPCYVDALYPEVGVATYKLLKSLGLDVAYPLDQTCCGQPMANAGFEKMAGKIADSFDEKFAEFDYVVAPSASCAAFVKLYHPRVHHIEEDYGRSGVHSRRSEAHQLEGELSSCGECAQFMSWSARIGTLVAV